jgi:hypothetical protein
MSDRMFERSLSGLTLLVLLWIVLGIVFQVIAWGWVLLIGLVVEIGGGGALLYYWGKSYMARE